jgi:hypothetical protein
MPAGVTSLYPRPIAGRLRGDTLYDLVVIGELGGAVAVRSDDDVTESVVRAARRTGYAAWAGSRSVPVDRLPRVAPHLLWVNPTSADLLRLRWTTRLQDPRQRGTAQPVLHEVAASRFGGGLAATGKQSAAVGHDAQL